MLKLIWQGLISAFLIYLHAMQANISYSKGPVLQALRYHFISRREIKLMIILVNVFALVSAVLFYTKMVTPFAFLISSFLWIVLMLAFWWFLPAAIYRRSPTFKDHFVGHLEENHFFIENERGSKSWAWREFSNLLETPHFFHLYFSPRSFFLLPKDAFDDNVTDTHTVRTFLKSKIASQ